MMRDFTILTVTNDDKFLSLVRRQVHSQFAGGSRVVVAGTVDKASSLVDTVHPRLIILHWTGNGGRYEQLDRLLWTTTVQARQIPILVIAERYRTDQATMMYRLGVTDYISRTHHLDQLGSIFAAYLPRASVRAQETELPKPTESPEPLGQTTKSWTLNHQAGTISSQAV